MILFEVSIQILSIMSDAYYLLFYQFNTFCIASYYTPCLALSFLDYYQGKNKKEKKEGKIVIMSKMSSLSTALY